MNLKFTLYVTVWTCLMILFGFNALILAGYISAPPILAILTVILFVGVYSFGVLLMYKRLVEKVKTRYPFAYPGEPDEYLPGFSIPRSIIEDVREHPEYFEKKNEK